MSVNHCEFGYAVVMISFLPTGVSILEEIMAHPDIISVGVSVEAARAALSEIGFTETMISSNRAMLSGGWKMKLLIIRAMLCKADILLLDEVQILCSHSVWF